MRRLLQRASMASLSLGLAFVPVSVASASNNHTGNLDNHSCDSTLAHRWTGSTVYANTTADLPSAYAGTCKKLYVSVVYTFNGGSRTKEDYAYPQANPLNPDYIAHLVFAKPAGFSLVYSMHRSWTEYYGNCGTMGCQLIPSTKSKSLS